MQFRLRWARVVLDDTDLAAPSILAGNPQLSTEGLARREKQIAKFWQRVLGGEISERPQLLSLRRANVAGLLFALNLLAIEPGVRGRAPMVVLVELWAGRVDDAAAYLREALQISRAAGIALPLWRGCRGAARPCADRVGFPGIVASRGRVDRWICR